MRHLQAEDHIERPEHPAEQALPAGYQHQRPHQRLSQRGPETLGDVLHPADLRFRNRRWLGPPDCAEDRGRDQVGGGVGGDRHGSCEHLEQDAGQRRPGDLGDRLGARQAGVGRRQVFPRHQ